MIAAKYGYVQEHIKRQAEDGTYVKKYIGKADVSAYDGAFGRLEPGFEGTVDAPIARDRSSIIKRKIDPDGDRAVTHFTVLSVDGTDGTARMEFRLETGRTHQIRVHCAYAGFPLVGDSLYNPAFSDGRGSDGTHQLLHAWRAEFTDPLTGEKEVLTSLPDF